MTNKEFASLDAHEFFSNATQAAMTVIENVLRKHHCAHTNLNGLLYFSCLFLRLILFRLDVRERGVMSRYLRETLQTAANDGKAICDVIMSAKIDTPEGSDQAMQMMIASLGGSGRVDTSLFVDVARHTQSLSMVDDGLWKLDDHFPYTAALEKDLESELNDLIDEKINEINQTDVKLDGSPELNFLIGAAISTGVMIGHGSVLYHQSVDELIDTAIKQINEVNQYSDKQKFREVNPNKLN